MCVCINTHFFRGWQIKGLVDSLTFSGNPVVSKTLFKTKPLKVCTMRVCLCWQIAVLFRIHHFLSRKWSFEVIDGLQQTLMTLNRKKWLSIVGGWMVVFTLWDKLHFTFTTLHIVWQRLTRCMHKTGVIRKWSEGRKKRSKLFVLWFV